MHYVPCQSLCDKVSERCPGCGRSREVINSVKAIVQQAVQLGIEQGYDNIDDYADALAASIKKKLHRQRQILEANS